MLNWQRSCWWALAVTIDFLLVPKLGLGTPGCEALLRDPARKAPVREGRAQAPLGHERIAELAALLLVCFGSNYRLTKDIAELGAFVQEFRHALFREEIGFDDQANPATRLP